MANQITKPMIDEFVRNGCFPIIHLASGCAFQIVGLFLFATALGFTLYFLTEKDYQDAILSGAIAFTLAGFAMVCYIIQRLIEQSNERHKND